MLECWLRFRSWRWCWVVVLLFAGVDLYQTDISSAPGGDTVFGVTDGAVCVSVWVSNGCRFEAVEPYETFIKVLEPVDACLFAA